MNVCLPCGPSGSPLSMAMRIAPPFSGSLNFGSNPPRSRKRAANGSVSKEDWERERLAPVPRAKTAHTRSMRTPRALSPLKAISRTAHEPQRSNVEASRTSDPHLGHVADDLERRLGGGANLVHGDAVRTLDENEASALLHVEDGEVRDDAVDARPPGERQRAAVQDLLLAVFRDVLHRDDDAPRGRDEIHRPAHALHELSGDHPVRDRPFGVDLHRTQDAEVDMAAADHREGVRRREERGAGNDRDGFLSGVDEVGIDLTFRGVRPPAENAVLGLEDDLHALRDEVRDERRHANAEVHVHPVVELGGRAPDDAVPVELRHPQPFRAVRRSMRLTRGATTTRFTKMPGVSTSSGSSPPGSTSSSTSAIVIRPAVAAIGLKLRAVFRYTRLPSRSAFHAATNAKSPVMPRSRTCSRPSKTFVSLPSATIVPAPVGV